MAVESSLAGGERGAAELTKLKKVRGEGAANKEAEITRVVEGTCECVGSNLGIIKAEREKTKAKRGGRSEKGTSGEGPGKPTTQTSQTGQKGIERSKVGIRERGKGETVSELGLQGAVDEGESETGGEGRSEETLAEGGNSVVERGKVVGEVKCHSSVETKVLVRVVWGKEGERRTPDAEAVLEERAEEGGMVREGGNQASGGATVESPSDSTLASIKGEATPIAVSDVYMQRAVAIRESGISHERTAPVLLYALYYAVQQCRAYGYLV